MQVTNKKEFEVFANEVFAPACKGRGLTPILNQVPAQSLAYVKSINGIKVEVKLRKSTLCLIAGWGNTDEERDLIKAELDKIGREREHNAAKLIFAPYTSMDDFFKFLEELEAIDDIVKRERQGLGTRLFAKSYDTVKIAKRYFYAIENEDQDLLDLARNLLSADGYDKDIAINTPTEERTYREHIVPCIKIHNEVISRVVAGATVEEIADFIRDNLKIAYIKPADATYIDIDLGFKTTMPPGWNWGDSLTARLDEAKVLY